MCTTNVYVNMRPDGRRSTTPQVLLCPSSRFGRVCAAHVEVHHPTPHDMLVMPPPAPVTNMPPTPSYSPRPSSSRESGSESERRSSRSSRHSSRHSSTASAQRRQRSPGVYVNGQRVVDAHGSSRRERILLVPNPPTPRTPPQSYQMPRTAPPSPSANLAVPHGSSPRDSYNRPYIVDERPRIHVQLNNLPASPAPSSRHSRQASTSSRGSRRSSNADADDEERRRRRQEREERREAHKAQELRERIEKANAEIANRPAVRVVNNTGAATVERKSRRDDFDGVVDSLGRMTVEDRNWKETKAHKKALKLEQEEKQADEERERRERTMPRRRATVGPGSRRHRIAYDDGLYRWE